MESIHQKHRIGNLLIFYAYYADQNHREQPAMFLANRRRKGFSYAIPLDYAHEFGDESVVMAKAFTIAQHLDMGYSRQTLFQIADAILNYLPDLVRMPPKQERPPAETEQQRPSIEVVH